MTEKNTIQTVNKISIKELADSLVGELEYRFPQLDKKIKVMGSEIHIYVGTKIMECDTDDDICDDYTINVNGKIETNDLMIEIFPKRYERDYDIIGLGIVLTFKNENVDGYMIYDIAELIHGLISIYR